MGDGFKRFVEFATDSQYVPLGSKCDLCGKKLGFFATGFWSTNTKHVEGGNLCKACDERIQTLIRDKKRWMSKHMQENSPLAGYTLGNWRTMPLQEAKLLLEMKEQADRGELAKYGESASAYLIVQEAFRIEPKATEVGVVRVKGLAQKMVVYGRVEQGTFSKGDAVCIDNEGKLLNATVLEAYEDDGENYLRYMSAPTWADRSLRRIRPAGCCWILQGTCSRETGSSSKPMRKRVRRLG